MIDLLPYNYDRNSLVLEKVSFDEREKLIHCIKFEEQE